MMEKQTVRILTVVLLCALLLSSSAVLAQPGTPSLAASAMTQATASGGGYRLSRPGWHASGVASGRGYSLSSLDWQASVVASGGGYLLLRPASASAGSQCCCTFLPCVLRDY